MRARMWSHLLAKSRVPRSGISDQERLPFDYLVLLFIDREVKLVTQSPRATSWQPGRGRWLGDEKTHGLPLRHKRVN